MQNLRDLLEDARRAARVQDERDPDGPGATYLEGKAEGIAAALEVLGITPDPWKPRPRTPGYREVEQGEEIPRPSPVEWGL